MTNLTEDDVKALKRLVPYADQLEEQAELDAARSLLKRFYGKSIVGFAGLIAAGIVITANLKTVVGWTVKWATGG